jgi:hypothetical protein
VLDVAYSKLIPRQGMIYPSSCEERGIPTDYKGGYTLANKIKGEGFEADLYRKH